MTNIRGVKLNTATIVIQNFTKICDPSVKCPTVQKNARAFQKSDMGQIYMLYLYLAEYSAFMCPLIMKGQIAFLVHKIIKRFANLLVSLIILFL